MVLAKYFRDEGEATGLEKGREESRAEIERVKAENEEKQAEIENLRKLLQESEARNGNKQEE